MNKDFEKASLEIYDKLFELGKQIYGGRDKQKPLLQDIIDFENKWIIEIGAENIQFESDFINEFELTKSKLLRKLKKCVIFGSVSSGKSTLINALIAKEILATGFGSTSNCFVEITASPTNENYLVVNNEKKSIEELKELNNINSTNHLENGSLITMYYDKNECELLKDNIVIIDAPGINSTFINENSMEEYFKDADVVVLVVNAQSGITEPDEKFFKDFRTRYTKLNVIIVYNFWDFVNPNGDDISLQEQCYTNAKNILCNMLQLTDAEAHSSIFFISASERIKILTKDTTPNPGSQSNERKESFENFFNYLKVKMSESLFKKNYKYLKNLKSMVALRFSECQNCVFQMKDKGFNLEQNITNELKNIEELQVKQIISEIFNNSFESLIMKGLDLEKVDKTENVTKENNAKNFKYEKISSSDNYNEKYRQFLQENTEKNLENAKKKLIDLIQHQDEHINSFRQNIFNEIYFPRYFHLNSELNSFDIESFKDTLRKINRLIKICSRITIGLTSLSLSAGAATGGALYPLIIAAEIAIVGGSAAGGAIGGGALGAGASFGGIKLIKLPFRFAWKNHEITIRKLWNSFELNLMENYTKFVNCMSSNIAELILPIEENANKFQNKLNSIGEELKILASINLS